RRRFQRLRLSKPILASARGNNVLILDLGIAGAFLEHYGRAEPGERFRLAFRWQGEDVEFGCEVVRSVIVREYGGDGRSAVSHTGVRFVEDVGHSRERLKDLIATFVGRVLAAQKANAAGEPSGETVLAQLGHARRMRTAGFHSYRLKDGRWWCIPTQSPAQPNDGFTVAAYEDEEEIQTLCRTYEQSDEEGRRLIRLVAELSVMSAKKPGSPPQ
ncbi:MAG TPA: PilZ domain-containing protein, partial [Thermoanaerobaculia bacterium]|nr:PilZ domain-containing protein [Thermoanaerobaculia bacterium]